VANDLEVRLPAIDERPDPDIARDAITAIQSQHPMSLETIKVAVRDGWVTLEGETEWQYQRDAAENAVRRVRGVKGVSNMIAVEPRAKPADIWQKIQEALKRNAEVDANRVTVETDGSEVILSGTVRSWTEHHEAERVAWSVPGVTKVEDRIVVAHPWPAWSRNQPKLIWPDLDGGQRALGLLPLSHPDNHGSRCVAPTT
jgi:osmotically-inducible protein OsmY